MSVSRTPVTPVGPTREEADRDRIRRAYDAAYRQLVQDLSQDSTRQGDPRAAVDAAFVTALRRPSAFRFHDDPVVWLRGEASRHLDPAAPGKAMGQVVTGEATPYATLVERARRTGRRRRTAAIAGAATVLTAIVAWGAIWGPTLQSVEIFQHRPITVVDDPPRAP